MIGEFTNLPHSSQLAQLRDLGVDENVRLVHLQSIRHYLNGSAIIVNKNEPASVLRGCYTQGPTSRKEVKMEVAWRRMDFDDPPDNFQRLLSRIPNFILTRRAYNCVPPNSSRSHSARTNEYCGSLANQWIE